jgi:DNA-binding transcriptional MerR regulator
MEIRIGDLAKRSGCEVVTIRYYERKGYCQSQREAVATFGVR